MKDNLRYTILYVRISKDDDAAGDSNSITTQLAILQKYANDHAYQNIKVIKDDGYSGTNFNRPGFQEMYSLVKSRQVERILVKDLSRLGRNYIETGRFIDLEFPRYNTQFIAVNENFDSNGGDRFLVAVWNLLNELYAMDISNKQKQSIRAKSDSGRHITSKIPFGYKLDPEDKHKWIIDKKVIHNSDDKLKIFPNTHPAIIDKETFQKVQDKISKEIRHTRNVHSYLFADYLYCMDCHSRMHGRQCYLKGGRTLSAYECSTYRKSKGCCFHGVPEMYLQAEVLAKIQNVLAFAKSNSAEFRQNISKALEEQSDGSKAVIQEELDKAQARTAEIDKYIQGLFEAKVRGEIDGSLFASLKKTYDEEKEQLNKLIIDLITKLSRENEADEKIQLLYAAIRKYDAVWELTPEVLTDFIEKIEVGQVSAENKKISFELRDNQISVFFWGVGIIDFM